ncbi:short-chain dehydrogenase/reductase family 42E member 1 [Strongylocentrotus purpuratus]|uniref:3-beta hydroxysteroid dehydrogenase/isomerase domain-containing protein n=1 Tax=Strongylocentrotus purpuratus TaxID=7668 RepID=A0A7M7T578_STRPU|nr:short-chain dehydrogenase/reductase family 42E member 1 [Strongylocentrotus purpuratus]
MTMSANIRHRQRAGDVIRNLKVESFGGQQVLVTGGAGFVGVHLGRALHLLGSKVTLFDKAKPLEDYDPDIKVVQGDIRDRELLEKLCEGVDCVFHIASYGMSGREMMKASDFIESINVGGTENIVEACIKQNVPRLVYTSTHNVVFAGQDIENGDESLPLLPLSAHKDDYSRTKSMAEQLAMKSNGRETKDGSILNVCVIRPVAIYGAGEQRHFPRIVKNMEQGLLCMKIGGSHIKVPWVHVDNLVNGHILAAEGLSNHKEHIAAGQVYFIADKAPVNQFEFLRPLITGLGYRYPSLIVPVWFMYIVALLSEWLHTILKPVINFQPLMVRTELFQVAVTHHFSIEKAKKQLGYEPVERDLTDMVQYFLERGHRKKSSSIGAFLFTVILAVLFVVLLMSLLPLAE